LQQAIACKPECGTYSNNNHFHSIGG
jgi:hypothetical protein